MILDTNSKPLTRYTVFAILIISPVLFLFFLPDWIFVVLCAVLILWNVLFALRYFVMKAAAGSLIKRIPNHRSLFLIRIIGVISAIFGAALLAIEPSKQFSLVKTYSLALLLVALVIFRIIETFLYTEIRENGILEKTGAFYHWKNIENFEWSGMGDKLFIMLRNSIEK